jgi:multicomponent K+:H+ antiporter subunit D
VGLYALLRLSLVLFGVEGGPLSDLIMPWMVPAGLLTLFTAALGAFAARGLRSLVAWLVIVSVGTLIAVFGIPTEQALAAGLYYMLHSTLVVAGMFLLVDLIAKQRGATSDGLVPAAPIAQPAILGSLFFVGAVAIAGMPPLSGFFGKAMILASAVDHPLAPWIFFVVLLGGLLGLVGLGRAGSQVFWKTLPEEPVDDGGDASSRRRATWGLLLPVVYFLQALVLLVVFGGPVHAWMGQIAAQLLDVQGYIDAVFAYAPPGEG